MPGICDITSEGTICGAIKLEMKKKSRSRIPSENVAATNNLNISRVLILWKYLRLL